MDAIMHLEQDWPEYQRATRDKMLARLEKFPKGVLVLERDGEIVATQTSFPMRYSRDDLTRMKSWGDVTNHGYLPDIDMKTANALYIVSGVIRKDVRGTKAFNVMIQGPLEVAQSFGLDCVLTGAVMPGYDAYCSRHGEMKAGDYAFLKLNGCLADPFLELYRGHGFMVPDRNHIIENYYPDLPSRNYGAIVVRELRGRESERIDAKG